MDLGSPTFRSAAIMHDIPAPRGWPHQEEQEQHQGNIFRRAPSWNLHDEKTPPPAIRLSSMPPVPPPNRTGSPFINAKELPSLPAMQETTARWEWQLQKVSSVPMYYPIEEWNTLTVEPAHISLNAITARISEFLRLHSIAAEYNNDEGSVRCRTASGAEFVINVWWQDCKGKKNETPAFLVHIQHVSGCSMQLNCLQTELRRAILSPEDTKSSMEGTLSQKLEIHNHTVGAILSCRSIDMRIPTKDQEMTEPTLFNQSPLEFCRGLLGSDQFCQKRLGLESLATLTDRSKTAPWVVQEASSAVLFDPYFQGELKSYLTTPASQGAKSVYYYDYATSGNHILALQILAQSLQSCNSASTTKTILCSEDPFFWEPVLATLVRNIQNASSRPLEACLSVRCFGELNDTTQVLAPVDADSLGQHLHSAYQFGIQHSALLEIETRQLLGRLQQTAVW